MKKYILAILLIVSMTTRAWSYSTAEQAQLGFLSSATTGSAACPSGQTSCWIPYSATNPMPISGAGSGSVSITAGSSNIVVTPSPLTGTGTVDMAASPSVLSLTTSGLTVNGNASLTGTTTANNLTVTGTCTGCGGSTLAITATAGNTSFRPLFATGTSAAASTLFIDTASPLSYNPSTGLFGALGLTTTSLTVNGNAALTGTTTISSAQILAGNATLTTLTATTVTGTTINGSNASLSGTTTANNIVATGTVKGFPFPEISLRSTTTDTTGDITPGIYTPAAGSNAIVGIPGYTLLSGVSGATINLSLTGFLPPVVPQGTLYLRQRYLTPIAAVSGKLTATVSDAVVTNSGNPFTASLTSETQTALGATTTDTLATVDTALTSTITANGLVILNYSLNSTLTSNNAWVGLSLVVK